MTLMDVTSRLLWANATLRNTTTELSPGNHSAPWTTHLFFTYQQRVHLIVWCVLTAFISLIGAGNNILVLFTTVPRLARSSSWNILILNYTIANFYTGIALSLNVAMVTSKLTGHPFSGLSCRFAYCLGVIGALAVNWTDALLALNRYCALFFPHRYKSLTVRPVSLTLVAFVWFISIAAVLPAGLDKRAIHFASPLGTCIYKDETGYAVQLQATVMNSPMVISGIAAMFLLWATCRQNNRVGSDSAWPHNDELRHKVMARRVKMARMLLVCFLLTAVFIVPQGILSRFFLRTLMRNPVAALWARTAAILNYALIPCILLLYNNNFHLLQGKCSCCSEFKLESYEPHDHRKMSGNTRRTSSLKTNI